MTQDIDVIMAEARVAAREEAQGLLDSWYDGQDMGACGFAWVTVQPQHKGNTKVGREERKILREMGFELDWTGKAFQWWNPSGLAVQNVDSLRAGAIAASKVLAKYGFKAYANSRLD